MVMPMVKILQRLSTGLDSPLAEASAELDFLSSSSSARAMVPWAAIGAKGKANFSTSEVKRNRKYPSVYFLMKPNSVMNTMSAMGI